MKVSMRSWPLFIVAALAGMAPACSLEKEQALRELKSPKAAIRARAVDILARSGGDDVLDLVAPLTRDKSARVRRSAIAALGVLGPGGHLKQVTGRLRDSDLEVRLASVRVLGRSGQQQVAKLLVPILDDESVVVRSAAGQSLADLGMDPKMQAEARANLELDRQLRLLKSRDDQVRATAARHVGLSGKGGKHRRLLPALSDPSPLVVREAAKAMALVGGTKAIGLLTRLAASKAPYDRAAAAGGLAMVQGGGGGAAGKLMALTSDPSAEVRVAALNGLRTGNQGKSMGLAKVCPYLLDQDRRVALETAKLVTSRSLACPEQIKALVAPNTDKKGAIGKPRLAVLSHLSSPGVDAVLLISAKALYRQHKGEATRWVSASKWRELAGAAVAPVPTKKGRTGGGQDKALQRLLDRFPERLPEDNLTDPLFPPRISDSAVEGVIMGLAGRPAAAPWLVEMAGRDAGKLTVAALEALALTPLPPTAPKSLRAHIKQAVERGLKSDKVLVRRAAASACPLLGPSAGPRMMKLLGDKDFAIRSRIIRCLGKIRHAPAVAALITLLDKEPSLAAIEALATLGDHRATPTLTALLQQDHASDRQGERVALLEALGKLADPARAAAALERELTHPQWQVRLAAAKALALSGRPASSTALSACRADYFAQVRSACETTLAALGKKK